MATPDTHRAQAKSLHKRGLITDKQHARMLARIEAMPLPAPPDPQMAAAIQPDNAPPISATASVPGGPGDGSPPVSATPPGMPNP